MCWCVLLSAVRCEQVRAGRAVLMQLLHLRAEPSQAMLTSLAEVNLNSMSVLPETLFDTRVLKSVNLGFISVSPETWSVARI